MLNIWITNEFNPHFCKIALNMEQRIAMFCISFTQLQETHKHTQLYSYICECHFCFHYIVSCALGYTPEVVYMLVWGIVWWKWHLFGLVHSLTPAAPSTKNTLYNFKLSPLALQLLLRCPQVKKTDFSQWKVERGEVNEKLQKASSCFVYLFSFPSFTSSGSSIL